MDAKRILALLAILFSIVIATFGGEADEYFSQADIKYQAGDFDGAIVYFSKGINLRPDVEQAYLNRGSAKAGKSDFDGAIEDYGKAIKLRPIYPDAYYGRARAKFNKGNLQSALEDFNQAIDQKPDYAAAYGGRGSARYSNNDLDGALIDLNKFVELEPSNPFAYLTRGGVVNAKGDAVGAIADANKAIALQPDYSFAYRTRGSAYYDLHLFTNALADFREAARLGPGDPYVAIFIYLTRERLHEKAAVTELRNYFEHPTAGKPAEWSSKIGKFLAGESTEKDLFAAAENSDKLKDREQYCEAYFYVASKRLISGDMNAAIADFKKCLATNVRYFTEYHCANAELGFLERKN